VLDTTELVWMVVTYNSNTICFDCYLIVSLNGSLTACLEGCYLLYCVVCLTTMFVWIVNHIITSVVNTLFGWLLPIVSYCVVSLNTMFVLIDAKILLYCIINSIVDKLDEKFHFGVIALSCFFFPLILYLFIVSGPILSFSLHFL